MGTISTERPPGNAPTGRIPSLDGLRGVAILMVLLEHGAYSIPRPVRPFLASLSHGYIGVKIFFALSGYLIYTLSVREAEGTGSFDWRRFYARRALRIFPCFYVYLMVVAALAGLGYLKVTRQMLVLAASFVLNYRHLWGDGTYRSPSDYFVVGHYWSLSLEEQFYLTWPLLMFLFFRRKLLPVLLAGLVLAPVIRVACYVFTPGSRDQLGVMFHTEFDSITTGVLLGELLRREGARARLRAVTAGPLAMALTAAFLVLVSPHAGGRFHGAYSLVVGRTADNLCVLLLIAYSVLHRDTLSFKALNSRPAAFAGVLSYSLYVWNNLFLYEGGVYVFNRFPLNFAAVGCAALASYYLIERPFLRLKDRFHGPALKGEPGGRPPG